MTTGSDAVSSAINPRAERSKTALIDAMTAALEHYESGDSVSVAEVSRAAGVSRPTLYQHYGDLPNLMRAAAMVRLKAVFAAVPQSPQDSTASWETVSGTALRALLTELEHRRAFYLAVLDSTAGRDVREDVIEFLATRIVDVSSLGSVMKQLESTAEGVHEHAMFLAAGALWRTERWLRDENPETVAQLAERLSHILVTAGGLERP